MCNNDTVHAPELHDRLTQLEETLEEHYKQLGKDIMDLTDREQTAISKIVNEIVVIKKQLSGID